MKISIRFTAIFAIGLGITANSLAQNHHQFNLDWPTVSGEVRTINLNAETFQIKDQNNMIMTFRVNPATATEDRRRQPFDKVPKFSSLKRGQWVRVNYYAIDETKIAKNIAILDHQTTQSSLSFTFPPAFGFRLVSSDVPLS